MVLGFFKHVYSYFQPEEQNPPGQPTSNDQTWGSVDQHANMVPCYDSDGKIIAYRSTIAPANGRSPRPPLPDPPAPPRGGPSRPEQPQSAAIPEAQQPPPHFFHSPWGVPYPYPYLAPGYTPSSYPPVAPTHQITHNNGVQLDSTAPSAAAATAPQQRSGSVVSSVPSTKSRASPEMPGADQERSKSKVTVEWTPWPDGGFEQDFTWPEFHAASELSVHWATEVLGGDKHGSDSADDWIDGKKNASSLPRLVRPQTRMKGIQKQLLRPCRCGGELSHRDCGIISTLFAFSGGVHYINGGTHDHARPTHILHLTAGERDKFTQLVQDYPRVGPLALLVGRPGMNGPESSVAEISSVLFNKDRIKSERRAVKRQGNLPLSDFAQFSQFEAENLVIGAGQPTRHGSRVRVGQGTGTGPTRNFLWTRRYPYGPVGAYTTQGPRHV
ncbi:hypothetical protein C8R46DRAFT_1095583 [Mycena filopes]|nr:hypothetical protein C8R46DRAFT_1095583 [Mycena filopes]